MSTAHLEAVLTRAEELAEIWGRKDMVGNGGVQQRTAIALRAMAAELRGLKEGPPTTMHLNANKSVAVSDDYFWNEDMTQCPRGVKVQLLGQGGVAVYAQFVDAADKFWVGWAPLPRRRPK